VSFNPVKIPPIVVFVMIPLSPTAVPMQVVENETPLRLELTRESCPAQLSPPSVVRNTDPRLPTANPVIESGKDKANRGRVVPEIVTQVFPPSVVRRIVPALPTAIASLALIIATA
jgi:hypothetical protein